MIYLLILFVAISEEATNLSYYKLAQKNRKFLCAIISIIRTYLWVFVVSSVVSHIDNVLPLITVYAIGGAIGSYFVLNFEPIIDKKILKLQRKGRRKKWGWLLGGIKK